MRGSSKIYHRPYRPLNRYKEIFQPYICRLAPGETCAEIEWFNNGCSGEHKLYYSVRGSKEKTSVTITDSTIKLENLEKETEYEFYIEAEDGGRSQVRLFRTGAIPEGCTVINYLHPEDPYYDFSGRFLGTPSMVRTKSGRLVASMDVFQSFKPQNLALLFCSDDDGKSWRYLNDLYPFFWTKLFYHKDVLYVIGVTTEYGNLQIACSVDEGATWSDAKTIFWGSNFSCKYGGVHKPPMQFVPYNGRLYTSCEYGCWEYGSHLPAVLSIDENADLMEPENWYMSEVLPFEGKWKDESVTQGDTIEGNIVVAPDGKVYNYMRYKDGEILKLRVNTENFESMLEFDSIVYAPVTDSLIRIIPADGKYLMITNRKKEGSKGAEESKYHRNVLSVFESDDLENFVFIKDIFDFSHVHPDKIGFQYPEVILENDKMLLMIRAAFNEPDTAHNSNYMLFCEISENM